MDNKGTLPSSRQVLETLSAQDSTLKTSPFVYYNDMYVQTTRSRDCSKDLLHKKIRNGSFTLAEESILKILNRYTYLNAYLIGVRMRYVYEEQQISYDTLRKILRKMVSDGLLVQYELFHKSEKDSPPKGSPFIYSVSGGGFHYLKEQKSFFRSFRNEEPFSISRMLSMLAENQFSIMLEQQYLNTRVLAYSDFNGHIKKECGIRVLYGLRLPDGDKHELIAFALRQTPDYLETYQRKLEAVVSYFSKHPGPARSILVICETEWQAMQLEKHKATIGFLKDLDTFYVTDTSLVTEQDVFDRLIEVHPEKDHTTRTIFKWDLRS